MDYPQYDPQSAVTPLSAEELAALDRLLAALPVDGAMTLDGLDGFLTALLVGPSALLASAPTADWLPLVWGGDGEGGAEAAAPFASKRQRKATVVQLLRHLRHLDWQLHHTPDSWEPIFSVAERGAEEWVDARDWCAGFLQAVDLRPEAWAGLIDDPQLAGLVTLGGGLFDAAGNGLPLPIEADLDDLAVLDQLGREVPDAALHLLAQRL